MRKIARLGLVAALLVACVGCDQISKQIARVSLAPGVTQSYFGDTLRVTYVENTGAFLSLGATLPAMARAAIFQAGVSLLVGTLIAAAVFYRGISTWEIIGLALLAASGLGNLIDRLTHDGRVTDFLNVGIGPVRTGVFNVADVIGIIGAGVFLLTRLRP